MRVALQITLTTDAGAYRVMTLEQKNVRNIQRLNFLQCFGGEVEIFFFKFQLVFLQGKINEKCL